MNLRSFFENRPALICFLLGLAFSLPYLVPELFLLTYLSLAAFMYILFTQSRIKRLFRLSFSFFTGFYLVLYSFLSQLYPFEGFGFENWQSVMIVVSACTLIPLLHALIHSAFLLPAKLFCSKPLGAALIIPMLWTVAERALEYGMLGLPWGKIALSQTFFLPMLQTESLFGPYFITLVVVMSASLAAYSSAYKDKSKAVISVLLIAANLLVGTVIYLLPAEYDGTLTAAALQGNIGTSEKWSDGGVDSAIEIYNGLISEAASEGAKLIVLPESAVPALFKERGRIYNMMKEAADEYGVTVVCGVLRKDAVGEYNSVVSVSGDGVFSDFYDKRHIVPFGEFIPFREALEALLPFLKDMNLSGMAISEGTDAVVFDSEYGRIGTLVCFDSIFPSLARDEVLAGAEVMTVVTNDSWFKASKGTYQHFRMAQLRAIECGRYFVQSGNTGISGVIDEKGRVLTSSAAMTEACCVSEVGLISGDTLYTRIGDAVLYIAALAALIMTIIRIGELIYDNKKRKAL